MSEVMIIFRILPADSETDLSKIESAVRGLVDVKRAETEPLAFGLKSLKLTVFIMDAEGESDRAEEKIRSVEGVGEIEVLEMSRLM
ncbi:MAG: elongation factor 1-beta [Candidatus Aenigmarchaeota archaeon]|nr:elongation factor 1-beta [Candidatus Aenigmarchaeota archaeon]